MKKLIVSTIAREFSHRGGEEDVRALFPDAVLIGSDEVGVGCLAGPVVAAAVVLPDDHGIRGLRDSKLVAPKERERLSARVREACFFGLGEASVAEVDRVGVHRATLLAHRRAVEAVLLRVEFPAVLVLDGHFTVPDLDARVTQVPVIKGDQHCPSVSAASIVAKVHRDALMCRLHDHHPEYAWSSNKGYGTPVHARAVEAFGTTAHHRSYFVTKATRRSRSWAMPALRCDGACRCGERCAVTEHHAGEHDCVLSAR